MKSRKHLKKRLQIIIDNLKCKDWSQEKIESLPESYEDDGYQIEICFLEMEKDKAHLVVSIDDGSFWNTIFPVSYGFFAKLK